MSIYNTLYIIKHIIANVACQDSFHKLLISKKLLCGAVFLLYNIGAFQTVSSELKIKLFKNF